MRRFGRRVVSFLLLALLLCHTAGGSTVARGTSTAGIASDALVNEDGAARRNLQNVNVAGSADLDELNLRVSLTLLSMYSQT